MVAYLPEPTGGNFVPAPVGMHRAVCFRLIDLGTQQREYQGQTSHARQVLLSWELSDELMDDSKPFVVSKFYTWSMSEKANLRKDLEAWRGKAFEQADFGPNGRFKVMNLIGAPCMLNVIHEKKANGDTKVKIASITPLPKSMEKPAPQNQTLFFSLDDYNQNQLDGLSEKIRAIITKSPEYASSLARGRPPVPAHNSNLDDDIPF
jgi:hypothetical protein